jgi:hypothetical protein
MRVIAFIERRQRDVMQTSRSRSAAQNQNSFFDIW